MPTTVYPKKYAHGFCFAVLCCGYILTDFPISIRLTSLALWQSNDCPGASKATLMTMDKYFMWIHYEGLRNHNKTKHNKTVCIFLGIYCRRQAIIWTNGGWITDAYMRHSASMSYGMAALYVCKVGHTLLYLMKIICMGGIILTRYQQCIEQLTT